ncbi:MAG: DedA family protein [Pseudomonadales bacterium]|uniref:Putative membrane protein n=1 Tax=Oleiphilus messinensis TaxID=141451 RepID=A0A1Y0IC64_9GAMM|nr:YqaA family protein [Oleiphilus messinensis]ARU58142.1 putative membrane protein [Oleiphilus messinensis]MCG8609551.1 DedA family protein [Pseudomonadales bacterium]
MDYLLVFSTSFLAATLLPAASEVVLGTLVAQGHAPWVLWALATAGNTLGSVVNWILGRYLLHFQDRRWFPVSGKQLDQAQTRFSRYGSWSLLFAWVPVIGDPLTFVAGIMRIRLLPFLFWVTLGKGTRYAIVVYWSGQISPS